VSESAPHAADRLPIPGVDTAGIRCPACSTQYGHSEALRLPLAERRAA
jgi:hypothetical protein